MQHPAFIRVHGLQRHRFARAHHAPRHPASQLRERRFAFFAVIFRVDADFVILFFALVCHQTAQILHSVQRFAPAADQDRRIRSLHDHAVHVFHITFHRAAGGLHVHAGKQPLQKRLYRAGLFIHIHLGLNGDGFCRVRIPAVASAASAPIPTVTLPAGTGFVQTQRPALFRVRRFGSAPHFFFLFEFFFGHLTFGR